MLNAMRNKKGTLGSLNGAVLFLQFPIAPETPRLQGGYPPPMSEGPWSGRTFSSGLSTCHEHIAAESFKPPSSPPLPKLGLIRTKTIDYANWQSASPQKLQQQHSMLSCDRATGHFLSGWTAPKQAMTLSAPLLMGSRSSQRLEPAKDA
jgi:hypothetical protein